MKAIIISAIIISLILLIVFIPIRLCIRVLYNSDGFKLQYRVFFGFIRVKKSGEDRDDEVEEPELKSKKSNKDKKKKSAISIIRFVKNNVQTVKKLILSLFSVQRMLCLRLLRTAVFQLLFITLLR